MTPVRFQGENQNVYYEFDKDTAPLGAGGMGCIYQGYRVDTAYNFQSIVAIKCIKPELAANPSIIQRAQREASVQVDHPNLIRMYGFLSGVEYNQYSGSYTPSYYIAMERLIGVNLDEVIFKNVCHDRTGMEVPLAREFMDGYNNDRPRAVLSVVRDVLQGIAALHKSGYIHRDIDPSNVMLTQDGKVKVIDFGISKPLGGASYGGGLTQAGQFLGKMAYAAPELIIGDLKSQGPATDIYALGIMLYQLMTGELPVQGNDQEVMNAHLSGTMTFDDIENRDIRQIIVKATKKDIQSRYHAVEEMIAALDAVDFNAKGKAKAKTKTEDTEKKPFEAPGWIIPVSAVLGAVLGVVLVFVM